MGQRRPPPTLPLRLRAARALRSARKRFNPATAAAVVATLTLAFSLLFTTSSSGLSPFDEPLARAFKSASAAQDVSLPAFGAGTERRDALALDVAVVVDEHQNLNRTVAVLRSLLHYSSSPIVLHLVAPSEHHASVEQHVPHPHQLRLYDVHACRKHVAAVWFIAQKASLAELCSLFLADILLDVQRVVYVDTRAATVGGDLLSCVDTAALDSGKGVLAAAPDLTDDCVHHPHFCWPLAYEWSLPSGLLCGYAPAHARALHINGAEDDCRAPGDQEPLALHTGVVVNNLAAQRTTAHIEKLIQASVSTWRALDYRQAARGASDLLNNYLRLFPEAAISTGLPCGCNYQYAASRRDARCPKRPVVVARGAHDRIEPHDHDPYARHTRYWRRVASDGTTPAPPLLPEKSRYDPTWERPPDVGSAEYIAALSKHSAECPSQEYQCGTEDRAAALAVDASLLREHVYVLTRTAARPFFFAQTAASVAEQNHPYLTHIVGSDDPESRAGYLKHIRGVVTLPHRAFDARAVCSQCAHLADGGACAKAPPMSRPKERQRFFDCYCSTPYPMNVHLNALQARARTGWMVYLDDDNVLASRFAISELVASALSRDAMLAFRSHLGRPTPTEDSFLKRRVVMGDFDSSNFAVHTRNTRQAVWSDKRCGDFRLASQLSTVLPVQWVSRTMIHANPLRAALGGLGGRNDASKAPITVVLTSYQADGWRPKWVHQIVSAYTAADVAHLVARVILVWNNVDVDVPDVIAKDEQLLKLKEQRRFVIVRTVHNSLNNRWTATLPHIATEAVLNLDDDVYVKPNALVCLYSWLRREPGRAVGPFVRRVEGSTYILDELHDTSKYSVVLPRVLLISTDVLRAYADDRYHKERDYVDAQEAHCDDILLNLVALELSNKPPLRVLLQPDSIVDLYGECWKRSKVLTGGLGLQKGRTPLRSQCVGALMRLRRRGQFKSIAHVATCLPRGNAVAKVEYVPPSQYRAMNVEELSCGSGDNSEDDGERRR